MEQRHRRDERERLKIQRAGKNIKNECEGNVKKWRGAPAYVWQAVVETPEGLVFGDVGVEELERALRDVAVRDHFVVPDDVGERDRAELALGVRLHGVELHVACKLLLLLLYQEKNSQKTLSRGEKSAEPFRRASEEDPSPGSDHHSTCITLKTHSSSPSSPRSTQVKVIPPRWLSLKRRRKVPGSLSFSRVRSISLLTKPMIELGGVGEGRVGGEEKHVVFCFLYHLKKHSTGNIFFIKKEKLKYSY